MGRKSEKAVIIGAGAIGLEIGYELKNLGLEVSVTEMLPQILPRSLTLIWPKSPELS